MKPFPANCFRLFTKCWICSFWAPIEEGFGSSCKGCVLICGNLQIPIHSGHPFCNLTKQYNIPHSHIFTYIHIYSHIFAYIHIYSHIYIYSLYIYIFTHIYIYIHIYIHIYSHIYSHIFTYIHMYSHHV